MQSEKYFLSFQKQIDTFELSVKDRISLQRLRDPGPQILYNTEQLTRMTALQFIMHQVADPRCEEQWDYSLVNLAILKQNTHPELHKKMHYKPLQSSPNDVAFLQEHKDSCKMQDLGFVGTLTPHRLEVLTQLMQAGLQLHIVQSFDLQHQMREMSQCKAVLNLHAAPDYQIFETARCTLQLDAGIPVFTESSLDDDPRALSRPRHMLVQAITKSLFQPQNACHSI